MDANLFRAVIDAHAANSGCIFDNWGGQITRQDLLPGMVLMPAGRLWSTGLRFDRFDRNVF